MSRHFLEEIRLAVHVDATGRDGHVPALVGIAQRESEAVENAPDVAIGDGQSEKRGDAAAPQPDGSWFDARRIAVGQRPRRSPRTDGHEQGAGTLHGGDRQPRVGAALESHARFGLQSKRLARPPHRRWLKVGALEHDGGRRGRHLPIRRRP
jgi:hypothetical protein